MNSTYKNACQEVYMILEDLEEDDYNKIPLDLINVIENNRNREYEFILDDNLELKEHELMPETKAILFNLFRDYLSTPVQKEKIIKMQADERIKNELRKRQNYNVDIFKSKSIKVDKNMDKNILNKCEDEKVLVEYNEIFINKILKNIKKFIFRSNGNY